MNRKLLLVNPISDYRRGFALNWDSKYPPVSLGILSALTPDNWEVEIYDENFDEFEIRDVDLVGITALTATANRAYTIAQEYKKAGIPVIIGGVHASMMPDEAAKYVDCVVQGEAEGIWPQILKDFEEGKLQNRYKGYHTPPEEIPIARHDLFHPDYLFTTIQTTRGCPSDCAFCSVHNFNGNIHRMRPVQDILDELEVLPEGKLVFFVDDNIIGYSKKSRERSIELFKGMVDRGIKRKWFSQTSLNVADEPEVLKWARKSGCHTLLIGIESEEEGMLENIKKKVNLKAGVDQYKRKFKKIQRKGIPVMGTFIFGHDNDTEESLKRRAAFIKKCGVDLVQASVLTPLPGTKVYEDFVEQGRLVVNNFPSDWQRFHFLEPVYKPAKIERERLQRIMWTNWVRIYNKWELRRRFLRTFIRTKSFTSAYFAYAGNWQYRRITLEGIPLDIDKKISRDYEYALNLEVSETEEEIGKYKHVSYKRIMDTPEKDTKEAS
jgi:radical SAM superfamily enzyme YgiQ (UPF0313 family)